MGTGQLAALGTAMTSADSALRHHHTNLPGTLLSYPSQSSQASDPHYLTSPGQGSGGGNFPRTLAEVMGISEARVFYGKELEEQCVVVTALGLGSL